MGKPKAQPPARLANAEQVGKWLHEKRGAMVKLMPNVEVADRLIQILTREIATNYQLRECAPWSLQNAAMEAAKLGLEVGGSLQQLHIVPFNKKAKDGQKATKIATIIIGYRGFISLMKRGNPDIVDVIPQLVYDGDSYRREGNRIVHQYDPFDDTRSGRACVGGYCRIVYKDGREKDVTMTATDIKKRQDLAQTQVIWKKWPAEMGLKTLIRNAAKYETLSSAVMDLIDEDDRRGIDLTQALPAPVSGVEATLEAVQQATTGPEDDGGDSDTVPDGGAVSSGVDGSDDQPEEKGPDQHDAVPVTAGPRSEKVPEQRPEKESPLSEKRRLAKEARRQQEEQHQDSLPTS